MPVCSSYRGMYYTERMNIPVVSLNNGRTIPTLGLGTSQMKDPADTVGVIKTALDIGYRLIDTAALYLNEEAVGRAIKRSKIPREEIFVTSKVWVQDAGYETTKKAFERSLKDCSLITLIFI